MSGLPKYLQKYRVRVIMSGVDGNEHYFYTNDYSVAVDRFVFYVRSCLEFGLDARCVNIFNGHRCIKTFLNHA